MSLQIVHILQAISIALILATPSTGQNRFSVSAVIPEFGERPSPRTDHCTVEVNTQGGYFLLVHGGRDERGSKSDTWTYGVNSNGWQRLSPRDPTLLNDPPPPMFGSIGGYRFVKGYQTAFLYITLGTEDGNSTFHNGMWAMELQNFTWRKVRLDGDLPSPRYAAGGGLERFAKHDDAVRPELIVTHGFGPHGPLSDSYKCAFNVTDPYHATWKRIHGPVNQYALHEPHPMYLQGSTFTAKRDLVLFGGCYSSRRTGGYCPSKAAWVLSKSHSGKGGETELEEHEHSFDDGYEYEWRSLPSGPPARIGAAMAQALNSFNGAYELWHEMAVVYGGSQKTDGMHARQILAASPVSTAEIAIYSPQTASPQTATWLREAVAYAGPPELERETMMARRGASLSVVRQTNTGGGEPDIPTEFYLLFGGLLDDGRFTNSMLRISFDPFSMPRRNGGGAKLCTRPQVHGMLMFASFGILMLLGVMVSRYFREKRKKSHVVVAHVVLQALALLLAWVGLAFANYSRRSTRGAFAHAYVGYVVVALATVQPLYAIVGAALRWRLDRKQMLAGGLPPNFVSAPKNRLVLWKLLHFSFGFVVIVLGLVNITLGIFLLTAPLLLWVHWIVYCIVVVIVAVWMELTASGAGRTVYDVMEPDAFEPGSAYLSSLGPATTGIAPVIQRDSSIKGQGLPPNSRAFAFAGTESVKTTVVNDSVK